MSKNIKAPKKRESKATEIEVFDLFIKVTGGRVVEIRDLQTLQEAHLFCFNSGRSGIIYQNYEFIPAHKIENILIKPRKVK